MDNLLIQSGHHEKTHLLGTSCTHHNSVHHKAQRESHRSRLAQALGGGAGVVHSEPQVHEDDCRTGNGAHIVRSRQLNGSVQCLPVPANQLRVIQQLSAHAHARINV